MPLASVVSSVSPQKFTLVSVVEIFCFYHDTGLFDLVPVGVHHLHLGRRCESELADRQC